MRVRNFVCKTNGSVFDEFRQFICAHVLCSKIPKVTLQFIASEAFNTQFNEYFGYQFKSTQICDVVSENSYYFDPKRQDLMISKIDAGEEGEDCITHFIYEPTTKEFKRADMDLFSFIRVKQEFLSDLNSSIHEYVRPQLDMLFDENKINVGLLYDNDIASDVHSCCEDSPIFNYIDFAGKSRDSKSYINTYTIQDEFLKFIALTMCDMMIGSFDEISYEAICLRKIMLLDMGRDVLNFDDTLIPKQVVFNKSCWFPNSQLLLEFLN